MVLLPHTLQNQIMNVYLFEDLFFRFRRFFNVKADDTRPNQEIVLDGNSRFLHDISYGLMPRRFDPTDDDRIIFDEEDVVSELYLIVEGTVGIGYNMVGPKNHKGGFQIAKKLKKPRDPAIVICDHYVLNKKRC